MDPLKILLSFLLTASTLQARAQTSAPERPYTPMKKDFTTENGVPFVVDVPSDLSEEAPKSEMPAKSQAGVEPEEEDSKFTQVIDEDTPVSHDDIAGEKNLTSSRAWKAPDFSNQNTALGYSPTAFAVPKGLETNVKFWIDVYSKYTTDQGVLHDSEFIDLIYDELDFGPISSRTDLNNFQKERMKIKMVKDGKKQVMAMLEKFQKIKDPSNLSPKERKVWDYFDKVKDPKKFKNALGKGRLRFQLGQKDRVIQGIYFSGRYIEDFERIFREAGLPIELVRLPFVESSYNVLARSKVGASGLWQIMPYTMKGFMKKDPSVDLRNHPIEATRLAAKLMRINFNMLQSWPLAMTGYNHGPSGVLRLTKKWKTRELGELAQPSSAKQKARLGFASRNFYASFLAVLEVTSHAPQYLGTVTWSQPLDAADIKLPIAIKYKDLVRWFDNDDLKTQIFNPHVTRLARKNGKPIPKGMVISVSKSKLETVMKELESPESLKKAQAAAAADGRTPTSAEVEEPMMYKVRRGDNLKKIAEEYGVAPEDILSLNKLSPKAKLRRGQVIQIPF